MAPPTRKPAQASRPASPSREQKPEARVVQYGSLQKLVYKHRNLDKMREQRNMFQIKGQDKTPGEQMNAVDIGSLQEKVIRVMIIKITQDLRKRINA